MIGYSEEYDICKGRTQNTFKPGSMETFQCKAFLNKSVENICDRHKLEKKMMTIDRHKGTRLNLLGDRVDCNEIRRQERLRKNELGAFGGRSLQKEAP